MTIKTHKIRATRIVLALSTLLVVTPAHAFLEPENMPGTLSGSLTIGSDYISRGISQTANGAAVMGSLDWAFNTGFSDINVYAGTFAANVDFPGSHANLETDFLAGMRGSHATIDWDLGFAYYKYHGATARLNMNYYEFIAKAAHDFGLAKLSGQVNYSPNYSGDTGTGVYTTGRVDIPLPYQFAVFGSVGHQWIKNNTLATLPDYTDWGFGVSRPVWKFNVAAMVTDTDLSKDECYLRAYGDVCSPRAVVTVGVSF